MRTDDPPFIPNDNIITEFKYSPLASNIERWNEDPPYFDEKEILSDEEYAAISASKQALPPSSDLNAKPNSDYNSDNNFRTGSNEVNPLKKFRNIFSLQDTNNSEKNVSKKLNRLTAITIGILILQIVIILK